MPNSFTRFIAVALVLCISAAPAVTPAASAQQSQPPKQAQDPVLRSRVELVSLFATVRDNKKRILPDLSQDEFLILEDEQPQKIEFYSREVNLPITLALLIDTSGSQEEVLPAEQVAAAQFLRRVLRPEKDMAAVINFDTDTDLLSDFTSDPARLERAINRARVNSPRVSTQGPVSLPPRGTLFFDAIYLACKEKLSGEAGRKALIILTDAGDQGSKVSLEEALAVAQRTDAVIHILYISDPRYRGGWSAAKKLTDETGGRLIEVNSAKDLDKAFDQISEELRSQYTLGYYSSNKARDGAFRKIKIDTTRKDTKVLARKGYYAGKN